MLRKFSLTTLASLVLLTGCANKASLKPVSSVTPVSCSAVHYPEAGGMVFKDAESWEKFWSAHCMVITGGGEKLAAPEVDFSANMLVGVFSGEKPTGGYSISILRVLEDKKKIVVEYQEKSPSPEALVTMVITYPCKIVSIPRTDKTVEFKAVEK